MRGWEQLSLAVDTQLFQSASPSPSPSPSPALDMLAATPPPPLLLLLLVAVASPASGFTFLSVGDWGAAAAKTLNPIMGKTRPEFVLVRR
eukprot:SAG31_NODE_4467_length_3208_cov_4.779994_3_plen_90_part_00